MSKIIGKHIFGNLYSCDGKVLSNERELRKIVLEAVKIANATFEDIKSWKFFGKKGGVSVIALVSESHIAIHTWNKYNYATVDVYTCGNKANPEKAFDFIVQKLKPKKFKKYKANRSF